MYGASGRGRRDTPAAPPRGRVIPGTSRQTVAWVNVPDAQSVRMMRALAIATDTRSPMSSGGPGGVFTGVSGHGVHRFAGRLAGTPQPFIGSPIAPIRSPQTVRVGPHGGPSSMPGLPSTGNRALGSIAALSRPRAGLGG